MPKRTDIHSILIIGSGPIVIGQGCAFDYSGVQACRALKEEGSRIVLINSNPATIMTDPEFADATYIEPISPEAVEKILAREKANGTPVDALLPTLGGQTGLNTGMACFDQGILTKYGVKMIGADRDAIHRGEDRQVFKDLMLQIGLKVPRSGVVHNLEDARKVLDDIGLPLIIRPAFTLGGTGGGIAYNDEEFERIVQGGLDASPVSEVLIEQSVIGWKEYELEVMRDRLDNVVIICSIENVDAMGVHTGDSITVAPIQTLTDKEYQRMRAASIAVIRAVGVETGGSNIQFGINPTNGEMVVIEMNPRVSRSSALASKATGYPIAKIAAKLAVGYTLDELPNPITTDKAKGLHTSACFEPTIDYCVIKIPRWTFEKFGDADPTLTTQMKSVGEAMAIGRTFKEALQKALRSLEIKRFGLIGDGNENKVDAETLRLKLAVPNAERIFYIGQAFENGMSVEEIFELTKIDRWFLRNVQQIVEEDSRLRLSEGSARVSRAISDILSDTSGEASQNAELRAQDARAAQPNADGLSNAVVGTKYSRRRLPHFERPWAKYAVTFGTLNRGTLSPEARSITLKAIEHFHGKRYELYAACVMPDHVHVLWEPGIKGDNAEGKPVFWSLAELVRSIKTFSAREINKAEGSHGSIWEKEWHDRMIRSETDLQEKFGYITRNPWDVGIASPMQDYEWVWYQGSTRVPRAEPDILSGASKAPQNAKLGAQNVRATQDAAEKMPAPLLLRAKKLGFSDRQLAIAGGVPEKAIRSQRIAQNVTPTYRLVDTCAAEFEAYTPYYYSTYESENERRESGKRKIMILGGGPNRIGQGIEFDYCCVHAAFALRELGFETIMVNSNPETVSTDYDTSDKLYFEPLTLEDVLNIYDQEQPEGV